MYVHKRICYLCDLLNNIADDFVDFYWFGKRSVVRETTSIIITHPSREALDASRQEKKVYSFDFCFFLS